MAQRIKATLDGEEAVRVDTGGRFRMHQAYGQRAICVVNNKYSVPLPSPRSRTYKLGRSRKLLLNEI